MIRNARLLKPYKGYYEILVDTESCDAPGSYTYDCEIVESGLHISCHADEFMYTD